MASEFCQLNNKAGLGMNGNVIVPIALLSPLESFSSFGRARFDPSFPPFLSFLLVCGLCNFSLSTP